MLTSRARCRILFLRWALPLIAGCSLSIGFCADTKDPLLDLMIQKGMVTQEEADKVRAEADALRTNALATAMPPAQSKWKISNAIKNIELFGDLRLRYEHRQASTPNDDRIELDRGRMA